MTYQVYQKYKDSGIKWLGKIPEHWNTRKLRMFAKIQPSNVDKKSVEDQETVHLCNYMDVYYHEYIDENINFMKATANENQIRKFTLRKGDTIITKDSETPLDIAVPAYVPKNLPGIICGYHLAIIRPLDKIAIGEFIFRAFQSESISNQYSSFANGLTRYGLKVYSIGNAIFPLPLLNEQKSIIYFLKKKTFEIDAIIADKAKIIEILQEYRQVIIYEALTKGLDPNVEMKDSGIEWIGEIPEHWNLKKIKFTDSIIMGQSPNSKDYLDIVEGLPFLQGNAEFGPKHPNAVKSCNTANKKSIKNDILLSVRAPVGAVNISDQTYGIGRGLCAIRSITTPFKYLYYLALALNQEFLSIQKGSTFKAIIVDDVKNTYIPIPTNEEIKKNIVFLDQKISETDSIMLNIKNQIEDLKFYRQSLISEAVTGKIDVRNYNLYKN